MSSHRLAHRYAKSLIDLCVEQGKLDGAISDLKIIKDSIHANSDLQLVLKSPIIKSDKKINILSAIFKDKVQPITWGFLQLLTQKGREGNLLEICKSFITQSNKLKNITNVKITTAVPIDSKVLQDIQNGLLGDSKIGTVQLESDLDENLIGGFLLEYDHKLYDASVENQLRKLRVIMNDQSYVDKV